VTDSPEQQRYRQDAALLARIGRCVAGQIGPITIRLPVDLAKQAARAWAREEEHSPQPGTPEQILMRHFAGTLAFVGLAVGDDYDTEGEDVVITLRPEDMASCLFAAEHESHIKRAEVARASSNDPGVS
jgi:hypothetical protein